MIVRRLTKNYSSVNFLLLSQVLVAVLNVYVLAFLGSLFSSNKKAALQNAEAA
jgi:hypothetical protein